MKNLISLNTGRFVVIKKILESKCWIRVRVRTIGLGDGVQTFVSAKKSMITLLQWFKDDAITRY